MNIYVGNLPYTLSTEELRTAFEKYGVVKSAEIIVDRRTNRSRGYGFIEMQDEEAGRRAIAELDGTELGGRNLRVDRSNPKPGHPRRASPLRRAGQTRRNPQPATTLPPPEQTQAKQGVFSFFRRLFG